MAGTAGEEVGTSFVSLRHGVDINLNQIERFTVVIFGIAFVVIVSICFDFGYSGKDWPAAIANFFRMLSACLMAALASVAIGGILGFLFGIPKLLQKNSSSATSVGGSPPVQPDSTHVENPSAGNRILMTNTSLEEISDWLTKIIIGLGLVQFNTIISYIQTSSLFFASFIVQSKLPVEIISKSEIDGANKVAFIFALIVFCILMSCIFTYLETRTRLTMVFLGMEAAGNYAGKPELAEAFLRPVTDGMYSRNGPRDSALISRKDAKPAEITDADQKIVDLPREQLKTSREIAGWASAQARVGNLQASEDGLRDALQRDPGNVDILLRLAEVRKLKGNSSGCIDAVIEAAQKQISRKEVVSALVYSQLDALYLPAPDGFEKSLKIAELLEKTDFANNPFLYLRKAAAFGQKYKYLSMKDPNQLGDTKMQALAAVKNVVKLSPDPKSAPRLFMLEIFDPNKSKDDSEDDLRIFKDDPEFKKQIES